METGKIIKNYLLLHKLKVYCFLNESCVCLVNGKNFIIFKLPLFFFLKFYYNGFSFLFLNYFFFKKFLNNFLLLQKKIAFFFSFRLKFRGLGYRFIRISKSLYRFFFISVNYFYLHIPKTVLLKRRKKRLLFLSCSWDTFRIFIINLLLLKNFTAYRLRGITFPRRIFLLKPGKKRF